MAFRAGRLPQDPNDDSGEDIGEEEAEGDLAPLVDHLNSHLGEKRD